MFLLKQILFCSPLIIYAGFRIWKLIPQGFFKTLSIVFYIFLVLAFPLAQMLSHASGMEWANIIMIAGYFSLPFLLYLVLWVPLVDLALGVALLTRILCKETLKRKRFRRAWFFLILGMPLAVVLIGAVRNNHPQIREYSVEIQKKPLGGLNSLLPSLNNCFDWGVFQVLRSYYLKIISTILHPSEWASGLARNPHL